MLPIQYAYPEDRNGTNPQNLVVDERHTITPANGANFNFIIPRAAPYFESSMQVVHVASGTTLIKGIDWVPSYKFEMASNTAPFLQIYGAISILTNAYDGGTIALEYQTLGGAYVLSESDLVTVLSNTVVDPRLTSWESVTLVPGVYLPEPHLHHIVDTVGYAELVEAVVDFKEQYVIEATRIYQTLLNHIEDVNNPHDVNLVKLGIERFEDVYLATIDNIDSADPSQVNYVSANVLKFYLNGLRDDLIHLSKMVGNQGDVPFYLGGNEPLNTEPGQILNDVAIVNTPIELNEQLVWSGTNPIIVATHTSQVYVWTAGAYSLSNETPAEIIKRGRLYRNPLTRRLYYSTANGTAVLVGGNGIFKDRSSGASILDRLAYVGSDSRTAIGNYVDYWSQNPSTGAMTYRGHTAKTENGSYDIRSAGNNINSTLWLGDGVKRHAGIRADVDGSIGLVLSSGNRPVYLDSAGILQHAGFNRTSDMNVKDVQHEFDYDSIDLTQLRLFLYTWREDPRISDMLWGKKEIGPIAQDIEKLFPSCVHRNPNTGLLTIDDAKLATILSIIALKRLEKLGI